jgi:hypothetical protein
MNRYISLCALAVISLGVSPLAQGAVIHESATLGPTAQYGGGVLVDSMQFLGSRFSVDRVVEVEFVGGHLWGIDGTLFAALVALSSPTALPSGSPFDMTTVATTVFTPQYPSNDTFFPLPVTLIPGDYALIFGSGQFGAEGVFAAMPEVNFDIPGQASYFVWSTLYGQMWNESENLISRIRFVVIGTVVPEPNSARLFGLGSLGACGFFRRLRSATSH